MRRYAGLLLVVLLIVGGFVGQLPSASASHSVGIADGITTSTNRVWDCGFSVDSALISTYRDPGTTTTGNNRFMLVFIYSGGALGAVNVEWNGVGSTAQSLALDIQSDFGGLRLESYWLAGPRSNDGFVSIEFLGGAGTATCVLVVFNNVSQSIPFIRTGPTTNNAAAISTTIVSQSGNLVYDAIRLADCNDIPPYTVGAEQTTRHTNTNPNPCAAGSTEAGAASVTMSWTWTLAKNAQQLVYDVQSSPHPRSGGGEVETPVGGGYGTFLGFFDVNYPRRCQDVTIEDTRSAAALAILYIWGFGDGTQQSTTNGSVRHVYEKEGLYTVTVRVQYRSGAIDIFLVNVNARGNECLFSEFVHDFFPILLLLIALMLLAVFIVQASKHRFRKKLKKLLRRLFLSVALIAFAIMAAVVIYTSAMGIPI